MSHPVYDEPVTRRSRRSGGRDRTIALIAVLVAVVATLVAVVLAVVLVTRPASPGTSVAAVATSAAADVQPSSTRKPAQPRTEAAVRTVAEQSFDAYAAGAYGEFWDGWTSQAKQVVSRKDYVRRFKLCPSAAKGLRWQIQAVTLAGARARVRAARSILVQTYTFVYQGGRWRYEPSAEQLQPYRTQTIDQIVREERSAGGCA